MKIPYHVYPIDDLREHITNDKPCWCHPRIEDDGAIIVHNSMDKREDYEQGRKPS